MNLTDQQAIADSIGDLRDFGFLRRARTFWHDSRFGYAAFRRILVYEAGSGDEHAGHVLAGAHDIALDHVGQNCKGVD